MENRVTLRDTTEDDLPILFEHQLDPDANYMAAFIARDPTDRDAFTAHWAKILDDNTKINKTILLNDQVAGYVACFEQFGEREVCYWIGKEYWGRGITTRALSDFLACVKLRPLYAHVAKDNIGSIRVLEKCGFTICGEDKGFAKARGEEVEELILHISC